MNSPTEAAAITNKTTPPINRLRSLFSISARRSVPAIDSMRSLSALNRLLSLFAIRGIRGLFRSFDPCGVRVSKSKSGISFYSIRQRVALRAHIVSERDESTMNPVNQPPAAPPPIRLPISASPFPPFHLVEIIVEGRCYPGVNGMTQRIVRIEYSDLAAF